MTTKVGEVRITAGPVLIELKDLELPDEFIKLDAEGAKIFVEGFIKGIETISETFTRRFPVARER